MGKIVQKEYISTSFSPTLVLPEPGQDSWDSECEAGLQRKKLSLSLVCLAALDWAFLTTAKESPPGSWKAESLNISWCTLQQNWCCLKRYIVTFQMVPIFREMFSGISLIYRNMRLVGTCVIMSNPLLLRAITSHNPFNKLKCTWIPWWWVLHKYVYL